MRVSFLGFVGASVLLHAGALALPLLAPAKPRFAIRPPIVVRLDAIRSPDSADDVAATPDAASPVAARSPVPDSVSLPSGIPITPAATPSGFAPAPMAVPSVVPPVVSDTVPPADDAALTAEPPHPPTGSKPAPPPTSTAAVPAVQRVDVNAAVARYQSAQQQLQRQGMRGQHLAWLRQRVADLMRSTVAGATPSVDARCVSRIEGARPKTSCERQDLETALSAGSDDLLLFLAKLIELDGVDGALAWQWSAADSTFVQELPASDGAPAMVTATSASSSRPSQ